MAAVDANVAHHLFQECIHGLLKGKTRSVTESYVCIVCFFILGFARILCTHHTQFLMNADVVVLMDDGRIVDTGSPHEVFSHYKHLQPNPVDDKKQEEEMKPSEVQSVEVLSLILCCVVLCCVVLCCVVLCCVVLCCVVLCCVVLCCVV